jgi:hypothetical protein
MADTPIAPLSSVPVSGDADVAAQVKVNPKGGISPVGNLPLSATDSAELLARMEEMVKERQSPLNLLLGGLKDASAWGSGGIEGPSEALRLRDAQKISEAKDLFNMRSEMAALRSAQAMAEKQDITLDEAMGLIKPTVSTAGQQPQGGQVMGPSGQPVPDLILKQMAQKRRMGDRAGAQAVYDDWAKTQTHKDIETAGRAESYGTEAKVYDKKTGELTSVPAIEVMRNPSRYSLTPITGETQATPSARVTGATPPFVSPGQSKYASAPAAQIANKLGATTGEFTDDELDRLASTESGKDPFALNKDTKAMGRYQFMPETVKSLHQRGIEFNPFNEKQARDVAKSELNRLSRELGSKELALAAYGGFQQKDPSKYIGGILTTAPAEVISTAAKSGPPPSTGNRAQDLQNLETWKKSQEKELEIASKGPEQASTEAGKRRAKMFELADATEDTVKAADMAIAASTNHPEATGIGKGRTGANALVTIAGGILPKMDKAKAEDQYAALMLSDEGNKAREAIVGSSRQLGIDFAANVFKGARMGIGLENMAANAKNVSEHNTAETNIINAKIIKEAALFNKARAELYNRWAPKNGGAMANFEKFETSDEYKTLAKATQEKIASELPQYLKLGKDGLEEVNTTKKSSSENSARAELERRRKSKENQ